MLIDSHCHLNCLDLAACGGSLEAVFDHASQHGVEHMLCVSIDLEHFPEVLALAHQYPEKVRASVGVHPTETGCREPSTQELVNYAADEAIVAIGETGLDYFRVDTEDAQWQRDRFAVHIRASRKAKKPLIIHTRQARKDTISLMEAEGAQEFGGVMHCFTEDLIMAEQAIALGFYISFSGIVTFKNAIELQEVAQAIPLDRILIETDAPYLAPVPFRGKDNKPGNTRYVAEKIAELRGISVEEVAAATTDNCKRLFGWPA